MKKDSLEKLGGIDAVEKMSNRVTQETWNFLEALIERVQLLEAKLKSFRELGYLCRKILPQVVQVFDAWRKDATAWNEWHDEVSHNARGLLAKTNKMQSATSHPRTANVINAGNLHDGSTSTDVYELITAWREEADRMWNYPLHNEQSISATFRQCADDLERLSKVEDKQ